MKIISAPGFPLSTVRTHKHEKEKSSPPLFSFSLFSLPRRSVWPGRPLRSGLHAEVVVRDTIVISRTQRDALFFPGIFRREQRDQSETRETRETLLSLSSWVKSDTEAGVYIPHGAKAISKWTCDSLFFFCSVSGVGVVEVGLTSVLLCRGRVGGRTAQLH